MRPPATRPPNPQPCRPWDLAARLALAVVVCGVCAGLIGIAMAWLLEGFELLFYGVAAGSLPERVAAAPAWRRVAAPAGAGLLAGALWFVQRRRGGVVSVESVVAQCLAPPLNRSSQEDQAGRGAAGPRGASAADTATAHENASTRSGQAPSARRSLPPAAQRMGILRPFGDAVLQVLTVGGGNSVGREGAPRLAAGAVAVRLADRLGLPAAWLAPLAAASAGAGLAAMYNAPLGGAAYAVEIMLIGASRRRGMILALPVSALATVVSWLHSHRAASVPLPGDAALVGGSAHLSLSALALTVVLAAVAATAAGWLARGLWSWARGRALTASPWMPATLALAGACTGVLSLWLVTLPGNGRDAFQAAVNAGQVRGALAMLLAVALFKPLVTAATLGAGATGGLLAPSFSLGACLGAAVSVMLAAAGLSASLPLAAVLGAATCLAVTQRAPVFAALFVWEIVQAPVVWLPVMVAACLLAARLTRR